MEKRKSNAVEFGHEVLMTNPEPIIFDRSKVCLDFSVRGDGVSASAKMPWPAISGGSYRTISEYIL